MLLLIFAATLLFAVCNGQAIDMYGMNEDDLYECAHYFACEIKNMSEIQRLNGTSTLKNREYAWKTFRELVDWPEARDTPEFWSKYPERICTLNEDFKKKKTFEGARIVGEYWTQLCEEGNTVECEGGEKFGQLCEEGNTVECEGGEKFGVAFAKTLSEYAAKGECGSSSQMKAALTPPTFG